MPNWNPNFPEVLGLEWFPTHGGTGRVWAGAPAPMARMPSTVTETINSLKLSATVDPVVAASAPTLIDVVEAGAETTDLFAVTRLAPNSDVTIGAWRTQAGGATNLFQSIDEDVTRWPGPAQDTWIQNQTGFDNYECSVDAAAFAPAGALVNARIGFVEISAILGANTGFRKLRAELRIGGVGYQPAGGNLRDVHGFGALYTLWFGELNPATGLPWTPADIAAFGSAGSSRLLVRSQTASIDNYPKVFALRLSVYYRTVENRVAVGVWRRPETMAARLSDITTDALVTVPAGTAGWAKATAKTYLFYWRQSVSPSLYGAVVADDIRWNSARQALGPGGQPPGNSPPVGAPTLGADAIAHDQFGRPARAFAADAAATVQALVMVRSDAAVSADSQPYRLDIADLAFLTSTQTLGQRVVPGSNQTYLGVRLPIIPPATGEPTLTVEVRRVSDNVLMGGTFTITAAAARALPNINGWRYVSGFLSSGAALVSGTAYEIRLTTTSGGTWIAAMPNAALGPAASFGGTTNGAFIGAAHQTDRDLAVTLTRQPDPPTSPTAATTNVAVTTFAEQATTVPHLQVTWTQPAVGMGANFARYELERQIAGGAWQRIAEVVTAAVVSYTDREAPRNVAATYRIRAVGIDGRFSAWATTSSATATETRSILVLASNHDTARYFVHLYEITDPADGETAYPILSTEGDELVAIHGADYQVVFMEAEDRGVGWRTRVSLNQETVAAKGIARFGTLLELVRSTGIPYVCAMDHQGNRILGHVSVTEGVQSQPGQRYTAQLVITPTHAEPVAVEVT